MSKEKTPRQLAKRYQFIGKDLPLIIFVCIIVCLIAFVIAVEAPVIFVILALIAAGCYVGDKWKEYWINKAMKADPTFSASTDFEND